MKHELLEPMKENKPLISIPLLDYYHFFHTVTKMSEEGLKDVTISFKPSYRLGINQS